MYEPFPEVDFVFTKLNTSNNKITKTKFNIQNVSNNKAIVIVVFDIKNLNSIMLLKKLISNKTQKCVLIPIYDK